MDRCSKRTPNITRRTRCARRGWKPARRRISPASGWIRRERGKSSSRACAFSRIPSENMVWADRQGNIGYQAVAITPLRPNWSGLVPVPGDGRYEWNGFLPINALPHTLNPEKGYIATANNYLFPPDFPYKEALHYTGADPYRASRISEVLGSGRLHTVANMMRLQNDNVSIPARSIVPLLRDVSGSDTVSDPSKRLKGSDTVSDPSRDARTRL